MPWKSEKIKLPRELDRRVKITKEDKEKVLKLHRAGWSQRAIAKEIGCSRRAVVFIIYPERKELSRKLYAERRLDGRYYNKEKHVQAVMEHRRYKQSLYLRGLI